MSALVNERVLLKIRSPLDSSEVLTEVVVPLESTIWELRSKIASYVSATGGQLQKDKIRCGRGAGGKDFQALTNALTVAQSGFCDGDSVSVRYSGDAARDLKVASDSGGGKAQVVHYITYRTHVMHRTTETPRYEASAPTFWIDNGSWVAKFVVAHLLKRGFRPAADSRGKLMDADDATADFLTGVDFTYVRTTKKLTNKGEGAGPCAFRVVNHFQGEDALTCKARLALCLWKHVEDPKHPTTCVLKRLFHQVNFSVIGGDLKQVQAWVIVSHLSVKPQTTDISLMCHSCLLICGRFVISPRVLDV